MIVDEVVGLDLLHAGFCSIYPNLYWLCLFPTVISFFLISFACSLVFSYIDVVVIPFRLSFVCRTGSLLHAF